MKKILKKIPVLGPVGYAFSKYLKRISRQLRGKTIRGWEQYVFVRRDLTQKPQDGMERPVQQITNLLNYAKTSPKGQGAGPKDLPASLSMDINGYQMEGTRVPADRLDFYPHDWAGKTVLDIGCNHGGMLLSIADEIKQGVGLDFDDLTINAANKIRSATNRTNLDFYFFNLENEDLNLIHDFIPEEKVDVTILLAVCAWIKNSDQVIDFVSKISETLLFESNGREEQQQQQIDALKRGYQNVDLLNQIVGSKDGREYVQRRLYFCY